MNKPRACLQISDRQQLTCRGREVRAEPLTRLVGQGSSRAAPGFDWLNPHSRPKNRQRGGGKMFQQQKQDPQTHHGGGVVRNKSATLLTMGTIQITDKQRTTNTGMRCFETQVGGRLRAGCSRGSFTVCCNSSLSQPDHMLF